MKNNFKFGVDYYPEHWPEERLEKDAALMEELGLKVVRMAEFSWHKMEPSEGKYEFDWLEKAVNCLGKHGISTVLGTPGAAPPAWMIRKYPEILPKGMDGITRGFGGRHHDCQSNETYREYIRKIVTQMALRFKDNPFVVGWQIDNEFGNSHYDLCMCESCGRAFRKWLQKKYENVDKLNRDWGTCFWSQEYNDFSEVEPPRKTPCGANPSQLLDWKRFHSDLICEFSQLQSNIIRDICPKNHFITHNCMGFSDVVSYYDLSKQLDFVSHDLYPGGYWRGIDTITPAEIGAELDGIRGITGNAFWIMEQQSSITGWETMGRAPKPGQIPLWAVDSIAHGADTIVFFRWRSCSVGTEQYWHGILPHSGIPGRAFEEIRRLIEDMSPIMDRFEGSLPKSEVAIVRSYDQGWAMEIQPNVSKIDYYNQLISYYKAFFEKNISVDFVSETADLAKYKLVIVPLWYLSTEEMAKKFEEYVKNGGHIVFTMRAGVKDDRNICDTENSLPGKLSKLLGISVLEYDPLNFNKVKVDVLGAPCGKDPEKSKNTVENYGSKWADILSLRGADALALYKDEWYSGESAVSVNSFGAGKAYYVGTEPSEDLMESLTEIWIQNASVNNTTHNGIQVEEGIEVAVRENDGKRWYFILNHTGEVKKLTIPLELELIAGECDGVELMPYNYAVFEEELSD